MKKRVLFLSMILGFLCTGCSQSGPALQETDKNAADMEIVKQESVLPEYPDYTLIWNDEFDGDELNTEYWNYEPHAPGWVNNELQEYTTSTDNVYIEDGKLVIQAIKEERNGEDYYTSGKVTTKDKVEFTYGKVVVGLKVPKGQGLWPAAWMMPAEESFYGQWPKCGEIDIMEILGNDTKISYATLHYGNPHKSSQGIYELKEGRFNEEFHEFSVEWEPSEIRFYVDDELFHKESRWFSAIEGEDEYTYPAPFDQPFFVQLNLAVGGDWPGNPDGTTDFENAKYYIDYVRVYQKEAYDDNVTMPGLDFAEPDETGNYVLNGQFEEEALDDEEGWIFCESNDRLEKDKIKNNEVVITTALQGTEEYSVQFLQPNISVKKGKVYRVSFDAYAAAERQMKVAVTAPEVNWIRYLEDTPVTLTDEKQHYELEFTMLEESDNKARIEFNMGNQGSKEQIHISNVVLEAIGEVEIEEELIKEVQSDGNFVSNGTFSHGEGRLKYWEIVNDTDAKVYVSNKNLIRELVVESEKQPEDIKAVEVKQTDIPLTEGVDYILSFDAYGDHNQTIQIGFGEEVFEVTLSEEKQKYQCGIKNITADSMKDLCFYLGNQGKTVIDNVKIKEDGALLNGSFRNGLIGWTTYVYAPMENKVSVAVDSLQEDSAVGYTIKDTGSEEWHIQLSQSNIQIEKDYTYYLEFDAKSTLDREIKCAVQRNGADDDIWTEYGTGFYSLTNEYQHYILEFVMTEESDLEAMICFSLGAQGEQITEEHTVFIDNVKLSSALVCD